MDIDTVSPIVDVPQQVRGRTYAARLAACKDKEAYLAKVAAYSRVYRKEHKEKIAARNKAYNDRTKEIRSIKRRKAYVANKETEKWYQKKFKYGITKEDWDAIFAKQEGKCGICSRTTPTGKNWHVDHDHTTGVVRGILCSQCNTLIGFAKESQDILCSAIKYLESFRKALEMAKL